MARAFVSRPSADMAPVLASSIARFGCRFPVTNANIERFEAWVGADVLRAEGMSESDAAQIAADIGRVVVQTGAGQLPDPPFTYDADNNLLGVTPCV